MLNICSRALRRSALMVTKDGMSPRDALVAATKGGPDLMGLSSETGTLDTGKSADLIAVDGDPLTDPTAVQRIGYVMVEADPVEVGQRKRAGEFLHRPFRPQNMRRLS